MPEVKQDMARVNEFGQSIGSAVEDWEARPWPPRTEINGQYCRLVPLDVTHAKELYELYDDKSWTYLPHGPFERFAEYQSWIESVYKGKDPVFYTVLVSGRALGTLSYLRIQASVGSIEVGWIHYSQLLQKTKAGTEAIFLMMQRAFDELGYRRFEWKCDALNLPSQNAAKRYGFTPEGLFRKCTIYKGRSRDTAWFSIIDSEWPQRKRAFEAWLSPDNFHPTSGQQIKRLQDFATQ